jgi:hypothetical protein
MKPQENCEEKARDMSGRVYALTQVGRYLGVPKMLEQIKPDFLFMRSILRGSLWDAASRNFHYTTGQPLLSMGKLNKKQKVSNPKIVHFVHWQNAQKTSLETLIFWLAFF